MVGVCEQRGEGLSQLGTFDAAVRGDEQPREEPLVDLPSDVRWRCQVLLVAGAPVTTERHPSDAVALTPAELTRLLRRQLRSGLRASRLLGCPELINFLCPDSQVELSPSRSLFDQALQAEAKVAQVITRIGGKPAQALRIVCGLDDGTLGLPLQQRRKLASHVLGTRTRPVSAATFVKNYEPILMRDLAVEVWRANASGAGS